MIFRRGRIWWYEFSFLGQRIRESTHTQSKGLAKKAESKKRNQIENGVNHTKSPKRAATFAVLAKEWLETNPHWAARTKEANELKLTRVMPYFGKLLLADIESDDVARYQSNRLRAGASARTVNMEVGTLRAILRKHRLWANIRPDVKMLRERSDVGRALSQDEEHRLLTACRSSRSRSLYPAVLLSMHTGLRNQELRLLRWRQIDLIERTLMVGKSKTDRGTGRIVPLSDTATRCLTEWRREFPDAQPGHYLFPSERYGFDGEAGHLHGAAVRYDVRPDVAIGSWKVAWTNARKTASVECRWHDLRHSFISKLAEGMVSDTTITAVAGWMSKKMMERYSHSSNDSKRRAIAILDGGRKTTTKKLPRNTSSPQNHPQTKAWVS